MNLETLKKYWNELEHYKNGGSLLARIWITDDNDGDKSYTIWYKVGCECWDINKVYNYTLDYHKVQIIINDEYSIYRKALTEGKIIQIYDVIEQHISNPSLDKFGWKDFKSFTASSPFSKTPDFYRIKPDEPKFKVGDFVTHESLKIIRQITKVDDDFIYFKEGSWALPHVEGFSNKLILWTPVKDEWCWFYDNPNKDKYCNLSQFGGESNGRCFKTNCGTPWNFCEPFLNSLPSYLKDK